MRKGEEGRGEEGRRGVLFFLLPLSLILLPLSGCKRPKVDATAGKKEKKDDLPKAVGFGMAETTVYQSADPKSPISFTLAGTSGHLALVDGNVETGRLAVPHGHLYQNGKPTSTYRADTGDAVRASKRLNMKHHVVVQSLDKTQTLTADNGEYRGDVKIVRAIGNVVAKTPSGTLSGAPELWATPDLKLIGTPDMVAKTLKIPALVALAATAAAGSAQLKGTDYKFENQGPQQYENLGKAGLRITVSPVPGKPLIAHVLSRGMTVTSFGKVVLITDPTGKEVHHMTSQGKAHVVQTAEAGTTTMDGDGSVYDALPGAATGTLDVGGRVTLTDESRGKDAKGNATVETTVSRGDKGRAVLFAKPPKDGDSLKEAVLTGNVTIDSKGGNGGVFTGKGDRMVYRPHGDTEDVDLQGPAVVLTSRPKEGPNGLVVDSAGSVALRLDQKTKEVLHMTSQGKAHVVQTADAGTTTMDGDGSTYDAPAGSETGTLDVGGRVTLTNATRHATKDKDGQPRVVTQTAVSRGDRGRAILLTKPPKDGDSLKQAVLTGNVTLDSKSDGEGAGTFSGTGDRMVYTPRGDTADVDLTGPSVVLNSTQGNRTTVSRGQSAHAVIDAKGGVGVDPLRNATLIGGTVSIDVKGAEGGTFKGTGDRVVYTATGGGNGRAVMTGDLKFAGDAPDYLSDIAGADTAVLTIGKSGWKTINLENSQGDPTTTTITTKHPPEPRGTKTSPGGKKKKGGKG